MSLKAKIEAVIYASEEPVTLVQLTGLLGLEGQDELDALSSQQQMLALGDAEGDAEAAFSLDVSSTDAASPDAADDADALNAEVFDSSEAGGPETGGGGADAGAASDDAAETEPGAPEGFADVTPVVETAEAAPEAVPDAKAVAAEAKLRERKLRDYFRSLLDQLISDYANNDRGLEIREVAGGFRLATKPEYHDAVRGFVKSLKPPLKLSLQALETLAVVAYKQPVTAPEVSEIRGVDSAGVLGSLMTRKLVTTAGRKQVIGRPILYKTTKDFLLRFGLKDIQELPSMEEFEKMAGELNDAVQEEIQMDHPEGSRHEGGQETRPVTPPEARHDLRPEDLGTSKPLSEIDYIPEPTHVHHETPEDLMSDRSTRPHGAKHEPVSAAGVQVSAKEHSAQADGTPEDTADDE